MKKINLKTKVGVAIISTCLAISASYAASIQSDPIKLLQYIATNMVRQLKSNKATLKSKPGIVFSLARKYVVPYADIDEMAKRVVPPRTWRSASAGQRSEFKKYFTNILIRTYASALTAYKDQIVKFYPIRGGYAGKRTVQVRSMIESSSSAPIRVTYRLVKEGNVWRVFDMSVEGVSMLESFRAQFSDILQAGNMNTLLARLSGHDKKRGS